MGTEKKLPNIKECQENIRLFIHKYPMLYRHCLAFLKSYGKLYYNILDKKQHDRDKLQALKDTKKGKRCFIIGNGPSLRVEDINRLMKEDCFAANKLYKIYTNTDWRPTYYTVVDWHGIGRDTADSLGAKILFLGDYYWRKHKPYGNNIIVFYGNRLLDTKLESFRFSEDISEQIYLGATVTFVNLQIACYMGYNEIYLLGVDHNYAYIQEASGKVIRNKEVSASHFFKDEHSKHVYGDIAGMTNAYLTAKEYADAHGIKIYNATRGGKLEIFERIDFSSLFLEQSR